MNKIDLSWDKYTKCIEKINKEINFDEFDLIVGITRGGLPLSVHLSHISNKKMLPLNCSFRDHPDEKSYKKDMETIRDYDNILFVDDIYDSGDTIKRIKQDFADKNIKYYTIYTTDENAVDYYSLVKKPNEWITFPWETI